MPKFRIEIQYEESGFVTIFAKDAEQATEIVDEQLQKEGTENFSNYNITHRDYSAVDYEEVIE